MNELDITTRWVLLTRNSFPITDPVNEDANLRQPTETDVSINTKYGFDEIFERQPFKGTMDKLSYRMSRQKKRGNKLSPARMMRPHNNPDPLPKAEPRVEGGPNQELLVKHNLDEHSHPMDWFVSLTPIT